MPAVELAEPPLEGSTGGAGRRPVPQMRTGNRTQVETVKLRSDGQSNCFSGCRFRIKSNDIARKAIEKRKEITACGFPSNWIHKSESSNYSTPFLQYGVPFVCVCVFLLPPPDVPRGVDVATMDKKLIVMWIWVYLNQTGYLQQSRINEFEGRFNILAQD